MMTTPGTIKVRSSGPSGRGGARTFTDHMCKQRSNEPLAKYCPFGENATEYTGSLCLSSTWQHLPVAGSHTRIVESNEALASTRLAPGLLLPGPVGLHLIV